MRLTQSSDDAGHPHVVVETIDTVETFTPELLADADGRFLEVDGDAIAVKACNGVAVFRRLEEESPNGDVRAELVSWEAFL